VRECDGTEICSCDQDDGQSEAVGAAVEVRKRSKSSMAGGVYADSRDSCYGPFVSRIA